MSEETCPTNATVMANYSAAANNSSSQKENTQPVDLGYTKNDFNKDTLKNLKSMFEAKKAENDSNNQPKLRARPVKSSAGNLGGLMNKFSNNNNAAEAARCLPKNPLGYSSSARALSSISNQENSASSANNNENNQLNGNVASSPVPVSSSSQNNNSGSVDQTPIKTIAGEREVANYKPTVSLKDAMSVFNQGKAKEYVPKNNLKSYKYKANVDVKNSSSISVSSTNNNNSNNNDNNVSSTSDPLANNNQTSPAMFRNADKIDDRPKQLTTSLNAARSRFEQNQDNSNSENASNNKKEIATWEGKERGNSIMKSAKSVFTGDVKPNNNKDQDQNKTESDLPKAGRLDKEALQAFSHEQDQNNDKEQIEEAKSDKIEEHEQEEKEQEQEKEVVEEKPVSENDEASEEESEKDQKIIENTDQAQENDDQIQESNEPVEDNNEDVEEEAVKEEEVQKLDENLDESDQVPTPIKRSSLDQSASNNEVSEENQ